MIFGYSFGKKITILVIKRNNSPWKNEFDQNQFESHETLKRHMVFFENWLHYTI